MHTIFRSTTFYLACLVCLSLNTVAYAELPDLGDPTRQELTPYKEYLMGQNFYRTLRANLPFVGDLEVNDYVNSLGRRLISHSGSPGTHFRFFVIEVPSINAFAGPNGYIGFHTGLIIEADNESEFAGVMAHEIAHVTQRHLARRMTDSNTSPATMFATILAGILVASQNPDAGAAVIYGGSAALLQSQINFTRANEHEADRIGIGVLRDSGINPQGMASFFNTLLQQSERDNLLSQMEYLRTHPLNTTRVAEASNRLQKTDSKLPSDSLDFQLTRARLMVRTTKQLEPFIRQLESIEPASNNVVTRYTLGLAHLARHRPEDAIKVLQALSEQYEHPWIKLALADAHRENRDSPKARELLEQLNTLYPDYLPVSIRYAQALLDHDQPEQAISLLNRQLRSRKQSIVYNQLARAYYAAGKVSLAMEATSYEYELEGYLNLAIQQVNNALQQPSLNDLTQKRLESRKDELAKQIKKESRY